MEVMTANTNPYRAERAGKDGVMPSITSILTLADLHAVDAVPSAAFCAAEARERIAEGNADAARAWALKSLAHSVGVFHADYRWASGA